MIGNCSVARKNCRRKSSNKTHYRKIAEEEEAAKPITEKLQRRKKQQDPSRHGRRILQKGVVAFPNCRRFYSRMSRHRQTK
jgi:hypothetical protein